MYFRRAMRFLYFISTSSASPDIFLSKVLSQWLNLMNYVHLMAPPSGQHPHSFLPAVFQLQLCLYCYLCAGSVQGFGFPRTVWLTGQKSYFARPWRHTLLPPQSEQLFLLPPPRWIQSIERKLFVFDCQRCLCLEGRGLYSGSGSVSVPVYVLGVVLCSGLLSHCAAGGNCNWDWNTSAVMIPTTNVCFLFGRPWGDQSAVGAGGGGGGGGQGYNIKDN